MKTQILEGTFVEVQRRLSALPLQPGTPLRVIVTQPETMDTLPAESFSPKEFRNGLPLLPRRELPEPITLELVKRLAEEDRDRQYERDPAPLLVKKREQR
jgi:hypothetical protein